LQSAVIVGRAVQPAPCHGERLRHVPADD
jgi:hypothetical protein